MAHMSTPLRIRSNPWRLKALSKSCNEEGPVRSPVRIKVCCLGGKRPGGHEQAPHQSAFWRVDAPTAMMTSSGSEEG